MVLTNPLGSMSSMAAGAKELEALPPARFPIDPGKLFGGAVNTIDVRITLPDGWRAQLPPNVSAASAFGSYQASYEQVGRELYLTRRVTGSKTIQPPESRPALIAWMREIAKDDTKLIVINTSEAR